MGLGRGLRRGLEAARGQADGAGPAGAGFLCAARTRLWVGAGERIFCARRAHVCEAARPEDLDGGRGARGTGQKPGTGRPGPSPVRLWDWGVGPPRTRRPTVLRGLAADADAGSSPNIRTRLRHRTPHPPIPKPPPCRPLNPRTSRRREDGRGRRGEGRREKKREGRGAFRGRGLAGGWFSRSVTKLRCGTSRAFGRGSNDRGRGSSPPPICSRRPPPSPS